jgi:very-short-patch-repair endonuclease
MGHWTDIAAEQHAAIGIEQLAPWMTAAAVKRRVQRGSFRALRRGVVGVAGAPDTWEQRLMAAVLAAGPGSAAALWSAGALWGLDVRRPTQPIIVADRPPSGRRPRLLGVEVHSTEVTGPEHRAVVSGIPVTSVARTLCDLTAVASPRFVAKRVDEALHRKLVDLPTLRAVFADLETRGRWRSTVMRAILERRADGYVPTTTGLEFELDEILAEHGLPRPVPQHRVQTARMPYVVDLAYPELRIALEADGRAAHEGLLAADDDAQREIDLQAAGWVVLRYRANVTPRSFAAAVRAVRTAATARLAPS